MSRPITADLRRESIDLLAVGGAINDKLYVSSAGDTETVPLRTLDQNAKKGDEFILQNGHRAKDLLGRPLSRTRWSSHSEKYRKLQNYCYRFLEMPRGWCVTYHALLFFLVIGSLILTALSTVKTDKENYETILHTPIFIVEVILIIIFLLEYIIRLWSAGCRSAYVGFRGRLHFAVKLYAVLDMIVIVSSIVAVSMASNVSTSPIRLLRFLPLLRVLRFDRQGGTWKLLGSVIYVHRQELLTTFYLGFISLIFASFVLYMAEKDTNGDFRSWPSSFWWGIVTLTTVGYGDSVPESWYGKFCASLFALCGISFFALPAGILGSGFALKVTQQQRQKHFHRRRRPAAILLQSYWRVFCADLNSKSVATWFPHIYYSRQQHLLRNCVTGTAVSEDSSQLSESQARRKRSLWSKQKGLRRGSCDVRTSRSDSQLTSTCERKASTCSTLEHEFFDESAVIAFQEGENPCITLSNPQKLAIRLIRILKLRVAIRKFKEARRPYDVKDVIEQYSTGHVEMLARVKSLQSKLDKALGHRVEGDGDHAGKLGVDGRLARVEHQVSVLDTKLELVLQLLQQIRGVGGPSSEGSQSYELSFRRDGDGISTRRSSVSRAYSDPLDGRVHVEPNRVSTHVVRTSDIPCVTLSDPESVQSCLPYYDRYQGSRPNSLTSNSAQSQSGSDQVLNLDQSDIPHPSESATLNPVLNTRALLPDKRQLSDVTEADESLTDSKETVGGLTPSGPISQQNSTASDADTGDQEASPARSASDVMVWEKREPAPSELDTRRRRPSIQETPLLEAIRKRLSDEEGQRENPSHNKQEHDTCIEDAEEWAPVRMRDSPTANRSTLRRSSPVHSEEEPDKNNTEKGPFDGSVRSAPTRLSAKRRPLIKSTPVEV